MNIGKYAFKLFKIVSDAALPLPINFAHINGFILVAVDYWFPLHNSSNWGQIFLIVFCDQLIFYFRSLDPFPWRSLLPDVV